MLRASLRSLLAHRLRLALTVVAIAAGVAFVAGTYVFTDSLQRAFDALFTVRQADVTVSFRSQLDDAGGAPAGSASDPGGAPDTLPATLTATVRAVPGVAAAQAVARDSTAVVIATDGRPIGGIGQPTRGTTWVDDPALQGFDLASGRGPQDGGEVALLDTTAERAGVALGDRVRIDTPGGAVDPLVVGIVTRSVAGADGGTLVAFDLRTAQRLLLGSTDLVSGILVTAAPGTDPATLTDRIQSVLPADAVAQSGADRSADLARRLQETFTFLTTFLLAFACIALFVAAFLIYNTFSMLVAQRTRELALLRAIGASRGQVRRSVVVEAAVVGLAGAALGIVGGLGMALLLRRLVGAFGITLPPGPLVLEPRTVVVAVVVGLLVTVVSAYVPARRAARIPPVAALREELEIPARALRTRTLVGVVLLVLAALLARWGLRAAPEDVARGATLAGLSALAALLALLAVAPVVGRGLIWLLGAPFVRTPVGRLARENGRRNPRRTAATACALAIGLALMSAVGVIATSTKESVSRTVDGTIGADLVVTGVGFRPFSPDVLRAATGLPGASAVTASRAVVLSLDGDRYPVIGVDPTTFPRVFDIPMAAGSFDRLALGGALVDDQTAADHGLRVGGSVDVRFANGPGRLRIDGIYKVSGALTGFVVSIPTLASIGSLERDNAVYVRLAPGADVDTVRTDLERRLAAYPSVQVADRTQLKEQIDEQFDRVFGFVYALLGLAVVVAFLGIVNTLALSVRERRREVGLLRSIGASRGQIRRMVVLEAVLVAVFGGVVGIAIGVAYGALLQQVLATQGIDVLAVPYAQLAWFVLAALVGGFLAALWPAATAARMNVLRAVAVE